MNEIINNTSGLGGILVVSAFIVSIIVQLTKGIVPLPTKAWVIIVSHITVILALTIAISFELVKITVGNALLCFLGSFLVAYVAMYGFDTFKDLWNRLVNGGGGIDDK